MQLYCDKCISCNDSSKYAVRDGMGDIKSYRCTNTTCPVWAMYQANTFINTSPVCAACDEPSKTTGRWDGAGCGGLTYSCRNENCPILLRHLTSSLSEQYSKETIYLHKKVKSLKKLRNIFIATSVTLAALCISLAIHTVQSPLNEDMPSPNITIRNYIASVNSDKYHLPTCRHVQNILDENRIYYSSEIDARRDGKTPCSVCLP